MAKAFQKKWLEIPEFQLWLVPVSSNDKKAFCKACNCFLQCGKTELVRHNKSEKHLDSLKAYLSTPSISKVFITEKEQKPKVKYAEIKLSAFFAEHNIAFDILDHFIPVLKDIISDSQIVKDLCLGRQKCTKIVSKVIAKVETDDLIKNLKNNMFSILADESTDISSSKNLCILARYVNDDFQIKTKLLELVELEAVDCSAQSLFNSIENCFNVKNIPITNIIGFASDNAAVMIGKNNSVFTKLKEKNNNIQLFSCICHSSALISSKACRKIPESCENLMHDLSTFMSQSPKSAAILKELQESFKIEKRKILNPSRTRWLSMQPCIERILENWTVLQHFFLLDMNENKRAKSKQIFNLLTDNKIKSYFLFLKFVLKYFNEFNKLFQGRDTLIHILGKESKKILRNMAQNILKPVTLDNFELLSKDYTEYLLPLNEVYVGQECEQFLKLNLNQNDINDVLQNCQQFYCTAINEILKRLPLNDNFINKLEFLDPNISLDTDQRKRFNCKSLLDLASKVQELNPFETDNEWRELSSSISNIDKLKLKSLTVNEFWKQISEIKKIDGTECFPNLIKLVQYCLCMPHSNAEAERIFSLVTDIKTKKRNRIGAEFLNALCVIRSSFQNENLSCVSFEPTKRHYKLMNANIYN